MLVGAIVGVLLALTGASHSAYQGFSIGGVFELGDVIEPCACISGGAHCNAARAVDDQVGAAAASSLHKVIRASLW